MNIYFIIGLVCWFLTIVELLVGSICQANPLDESRFSKVFMFIFLHVTPYLLMASLIFTVIGMVVL